ncbi:MAG: hypothetical protein AB1505_01990 [Candidatus Latescibacterota bacterium]
MVCEVLLTGPRGDNPLGFLAALGVLATLGDVGIPGSLAWEGMAPRLNVDLQATAGHTSAHDQEVRGALVGVLHAALRRERGAGAAQAEEARKEMERAKTACKHKRMEIKARRLPRQEAADARRRELGPLELELRERTRAFQELLVESAADPSVALGKNLTESNARLRAHLEAACGSCEPLDRRWADLAAAYGVADPAGPAERMLASPWALVSGSGHQHFLSSVQDLMVQCARGHLEQALFGPWEPQDERYSLRLDASDDRRYALMARDPTADDNKPRTLWGANRLAFEALRFFPAMPAAGGMAVGGWRAPERNWEEGCVVRWPLWRHPLSRDVVRSVLGLDDLSLSGSSASRSLEGLGIHTVMESRRIAVGEGPNRKHNLTPPAPVWVSTGSGHMAQPI